MNLIVRHSFLPRSSLGAWYSGAPYSYLGQNPPAVFWASLAPQPFIATHSQKNAKCVDAVCTTTFFPNMHRAEMTRSQWRARLFTKSRL